MHPFTLAILILLGLYACGQLEAPRRDSYPMVVPRAERAPMTEAEKKFGCRFNETAKNDKGEDTGECP
jgi:hypothetical protein